MDYTYGPRAFSFEMAGFFERYKRNDWGVLTYPVITGAMRRYRIRGIEVSGYPQERYMDKYDPLMRIFPVHALWRLIQNIHHIIAAREAWKDNQLVRK